MFVAILTGPTASGKTSLALELAQRHGGIEIVNADSLLVYRGMDIGTAKPTPEELKAVSHHLIDIRNPNEPFTAGDFVREANAAIQDIHTRNKRAMIVGGTGFYLKALLYGLWEGPASQPELRSQIETHSNAELFEQLTLKDPQAAQRIGQQDRYRLVRAIEIIELSGKTPSELQARQPAKPQPGFALWVVDRENSELFKRIEIRTDEMLKAGLIEETKKIRERFPGARALGSIGYKQVCDDLDGMQPEGRKKLPGLKGLSEEIQLATRQLVKRQRTWFKSQKEGITFKLESDRASLIDLFNKNYLKQGEGP